MDTSQTNHYKAKSMSLIATSKLKTSTNYLLHLSINTSIVQIMESMLDSYVHVF